MFQSARKQMRSIAALGVAAALVVGGVAAAQGGSGGNSQNGAAAKREFNVHLGGPPPLGPGMQDLTYAELHVQKDGEAQTIRLDQGKITAVDESSITVSENDGNEVTIPVDADTTVIGKPEVRTFSAGDGAKGAIAKPDEASLGDLEVGQQVTVSAPAGGTAESIMVLPKKGEMIGGPPGGPMGPPPGLPPRSQQGADE